MFDDCDIRESQYSRAIEVLIRATSDIPNLKIIVIENNGKRETVLDHFGVDVFYTDNNKIRTCNIDETLPVQNRGNKELKDVLDCIAAYNIQDDDFVVKMTGRYVLTDSSEFIDRLKHLDQYECVIKYGSFGRPADEKMEDCITGLIGMCAKYVKRVQWSPEGGCIEWDWARATYLIPDEKVYKVGSLGIHICPGSNTYFLV